MGNLENLRKYLDDMNYHITDSYAKYNIFIGLHNKIKTDEKTFNKYNTFFIQLYYGFRDLMVLSFAKLFDTNSKKIHIFKIINFIKNNYKILNEESKKYYKTKNYEDHKNILYKDIENIEKLIKEEENIIKKVKIFRDKRISHNDKNFNPEAFEFKDFEKLYFLVNNIINEIDLYFFSSQTNNLLIKEDVEMDLNEIFKKL